VIRDRVIRGRRRGRGRADLITLSLYHSITSLTRLYESMRFILDLQVGAV